MDAEWEIVRVAVLHADEDTSRNTEWSLNSACGLHQDTGRKPQWNGFQREQKEDIGSTKSRQALSSL